MKTPLTSPKNWDDVTLGLFWTRDHYRTDDVVDLDNWTWVEHANCIGTDPDIFFQRDRSANIDLLVTICGGCAVRLECLQQALSDGEEGWWGGTSSSDRKHYMKDL